MANSYPEEPTLIDHDPSRARRSALSAILLLLLILLTLLLIAAATERTDILRFAGILIAPGSYMVLQPRLGAVGATQVVLNIPAQPTTVVLAPQLGVDASIQATYDHMGGLNALGLPISTLSELNGRQVQWFERGRLELTGTTIERALVGVEYTQGLNFPQQQPFADRADARFFAQTKHGLVEPFLSAWEQAGGLDALGYPISEQVQEVLSNGVIYTVQYFERGRLEHHPEHSGSPAEFQLGLLGRALLFKEAPPHLITPPRPTLVIAP